MPLTDARIHTCPCCGAALPNAVVPREELAGLLPTTLQQRAVQRLARKPGLFVTIHELVDYIYGTDPEGGPLTATEAARYLVLAVAARLRGTGWIIENRHGKGYRLVLEKEGGE